MTSQHLVPRFSRVLSRPVFAGIGSTAFDRLFSDIWGPARPPELASARAQGFVPRVDIDESEQEIRLSAELPGLEEGDYEVLLDGEVLSIKGERTDAREEKSEGYSRVESTRGSFHRSFRLPFEVDPEVVKASYKNGILEVIVGKPEEAQPTVRNIPVTTS